MSVDAYDFEELVMEHVDAESVRDPARLRATLSPTVGLEDVPLGAVVEGLEPVALAIEGWRTAFPHATRTVTRVMTTPEASLVEMSFAGRHTGALGALAPTHKEASLKLAMLFEPAPDGRIQRITLYYDALTLLTQLGALPGPGPRVGLSGAGGARP